MSVIYINKDLILENNDGNIVKRDDFHFSKEDIITSTIAIKDVISYTLKLPHNENKEQLRAEAEIQFYENAGLDPSKEYITHFIIKELKQEDIYIIEALGVEKDKLINDFKYITDKVSYIDFISFSPLVFGEFYNLYNKEAKRDAFVYLDENQSFIAVYENGEYLYSKTLNNLHILLKNISLKYKEFTDVISTKGVVKENYDMDELLMSGEIEKFFSDYFMAINNRLGYGKSIFYLDNIENIYFYTPFKVAGIETLKNFWDLSGINFEVIEQEEINFLDKLSLSYNANHYNDEVNFSIFDRPPKFYKTKTFQLIMVILVTILGFGGDYFYRYYNNKTLQTTVNKLNTEITKKETKLRKLKVLNKLILEELNKYEKEIKTIKQRTTRIKNILQKALLLTNVSKTSNDFIKFSKLLHKNHLQTFVIAKDKKNNFIVGVYTKFEDRKFITIFMNDLLKNGYKNVKTDEINDIANKYYISIIRFSK